MTPEQKERIRTAARELSAALTEAGDVFTANLERVDARTLDGKRWKYDYSLTIEATKREVIA